MLIGLGRSEYMKTYEPIQGKEFENVEEYNKFLKETNGLIYVNTLEFNGKLVLLYTVAKEEK